MGQPAYDYNYNGITLGQAVRRPAPQPERRPDLRVEQGGKAAISPLRAMMQHGVQILALGLLAGLSVALLFSEARIVELSGDIRQAKADLISAQSQNDYYTTTLNVQSSISSVEDVAGRLGLMKIDDSQITYIRLDDRSVLTRRETAVEKWTDTLQAGVSSLLRTIEPPAGVQSAPTAGGAG